MRLELIEKNDFGELRHEVKETKMDTRYWDTKAVGTVRYFNYASGQGAVRLSDGRSVNIYLDIYASNYDKLAFKCMRNKVISGFTSSDGDCNLIYITE